jgi:hypothetical protein
MKIRVAALSFLLIAFIPVWSQIYAGGQAGAGYFIGQRPGASAGAHYKGSGYVEAWKHQFTYSNGFNFYFPVNFSGTDFGYPLNGSDQTEIKYTSKFTGASLFVLACDYLGDADIDDDGLYITYGGEGFLGRQTIQPGSYDASQYTLSEFFTRSPYKVRDIMLCLGTGYEFHIGNSQMLGIQLLGELNVNAMINKYHKTETKPSLPNFLTLGFSYDFHVWPNISVEDKN